MVFEREKHKATAAGDDFIDGQELEKLSAREREEWLRRNPGKRTLLQRRTAVSDGSPEVTSYRAPAELEVLSAVDAVSRGERQGRVDRGGSEIAAPMQEVVERRAAALFRRAADLGEIDSHDPAVEESLRRIGGGGSALPAAVQRRMEAEFGVSFARVRVHTDAVAADAAHAIHAEAFTVGEDIFFASGTFDPHSVKGQRLIAHELTHVVQALEGRTGGAGHGRSVSDPNDALEHEAEARAEQIAHRPAAAPAMAPGSSPATTATAASAEPRVLPTPTLDSSPQLHRRVSDAQIRLATGQQPTGGIPIGGTIKDLRPGNTRDGNHMPDIRSGSPVATATHTAQPPAPDAAEKALAAFGRLGAHASTQFAHAAANATHGITTASNHALHEDDQHHEQRRTHAADHAHHAIQHGAATRAHHRATAHQAIAQANHHAHAHHHAPVQTGPIRFKKISNWEKYMPPRLPNEDKREHAHILKLVKARIYRERQESAVLFGQLWAAQMQAAAGIRALKPGLIAKIAGAQSAALGTVASACAADVASVQGHAAGVEAQVQATAAAMKSQVNSTYAQTVAQINSEYNAAFQQVSMDYGNTINQCNTNCASQVAQINSAFSVSDAAIDAAAAAAAAQAHAVPGEMEGQLAAKWHGDKLNAAKKAAHEVASQYAAAMPKQAASQNAKIDANKPACVTSANNVANTVTLNATNAYDNAITTLAQTQSQALATARKVKSGALHQIGNAEKTTVAQIRSTCASTVSGLRTQASGASAGIVAAGSSAMASVGHQCDSAASGIAAGAQGLQVAASKIEDPHPPAVRKQVQTAAAQLRQSVKSLGGSLNGTASSSCASLAAQAASAAAGMSQAAAGGNSAMSSIGKGGDTSMKGIEKGAQAMFKSLGSVAKSHFHTVTKTTGTAMKAMLTSQLNAYASQYGSIVGKLASADNSVATALSQACSAGGKEGSDIMAQAAKAAAQVKPCWQKALAFAVSVVVSVVIVAGVTVLTGGLGDVAGVLLAGAVGGALSTVGGTMASNLVLGNKLFSGISLRSVAIGAVAGAVTGGATSGIAAVAGKAGLSSVTDALAEGGVKSLFSGGLENLGAFGIKSGVNFAASDLGDFTSQMIFTGHYSTSITAQFMNLGTAAVTSTKSFEGLNGHGDGEPPGADKLPPVTDPKVSSSGESHGGDPKATSTSDPAGTKGNDPVPNDHGGEPTGERTGGSEGKGTSGDHGGATAGAHTAPTTTHGEPTGPAHSEPTSVKPPASHAGSEPVGASSGTDRGPSIDTNPGKGESVPGSQTPPHAAGTAEHGPVKAPTTHEEEAVGALEHEGYHQVDKAHQDKTASEVEQGRAPNAKELRDTEDNLRGQQDLQREQERAPRTEQEAQAKRGWFRQLAQRLRAKLVSTGELRRDAQATQEVHDPNGAAHDPNGAAHDPNGAAHDPNGAAHDPNGAAHDPSGTEHDPKGTEVDQDGRKMTLEDHELEQLGHGMVDMELVAAKAEAKAEKAANNRETMRSGQDRISKHFAQKKSEKLAEKAKAAQERVDKSREYLEKLGYKTSDKPIVGERGFVMRVFEPLHPDMPSVVAFRGTRPDELQTVLADLDPAGIGQYQVRANEELISAWMEHAAKVGNGKVIVTGHSLGGALAQLIASKFPQLIDRIVTFQSPGISHNDAAKITEYNKAHPNDPITSQHFRAKGDIVHTAGHTLTEGDLRVFYRKSPNFFTVHVEYPLAQALLGKDPNVPFTGTGKGFGELGGTRATGPGIFSKSPAEWLTKLPNESVRFIVGAIIYNPGTDLKKINSGVQKLMKQAEQGNDAPLKAAIEKGIAARIRAAEGGKDPKITA